MNDIHFRRIQSTDLCQRFKTLNERAIVLRTMIQDIKPDIMLVTHTATDPYAAMALALTRIWFDDRAALKAMVVPTGHDPELPLPDLTVVSGCVAATDDILNAVLALEEAKADFKGLLCPTDTSSTEKGQTEGGQKTAPKRQRSKQAIAEAARRDADLQDLLRSNGLSTLDLWQCYRKNLVLEANAELVSFTSQRFHREVRYIDFAQPAILNRLLDRYAGSNDATRAILMDELAQLPSGAALYSVGVPKRPQLRANVRLDHGGTTEKPWIMKIPAAPLVAQSRMPEIRYRVPMGVMANGEPRPQREDALLNGATRLGESEQLVWLPAKPAKSRAKTK